METIFDFDSEIQEIASNLKQVKGYLDCEKIIIHNIQKQLENGYDDKSIENYLGKLGEQIEQRIEVNQNAADCTNYRYVDGFINVLLKMPFWKSWIKTINM